MAAAQQSITAVLRSVFSSSPEAPMERRAAALERLRSLAATASQKTIQDCFGVLVDTSLAATPLQSLAVDIVCLIVASRRREWAQEWWEALLLSHNVFERLCAIIPTLSMGPLFTAMEMLFAASTVTPLAVTTLLCTPAVLSFLLSSLVDGRASDASVMYTIALLDAACDVEGSNVILLAFHVHLALADLIAASLARPPQDDAKSNAPPPSHSAHAIQCGALHVLGKLMHQSSSPLESLSLMERLPQLLRSSSASVVTATCSFLGDWWRACSEDGLARAMAQRLYLPLLEFLTLDDTQLSLTASLGLRSVVASPHALCRVAEEIAAQPAYIHAIASIFLSPSPTSPDRMRPYFAKRAALAQSFAMCALFGSVPRKSLSRALKECTCGTTRALLHDRVIGSLCSLEVECYAMLADAVDSTGIAVWQLVEAESALSMQRRRERHTLVSPPPEGGKKVDLVGVLALCVQAVDRVFDVSPHDQGRTSSALSETHPSSDSIGSTLGLIVSLAQRYEPSLARAGSAVTNPYDSPPAKGPARGWTVEDLRREDLLECVLPTAVGRFSAALHESIEAMKCHIKTLGKALICCPIAQYRRRMLLRDLYAVVYPKYMMLLVFIFDECTRRGDEAFDADVMQPFLRQRPSTAIGPHNVEALYHFAGAMRRAPPRRKTATALATSPKAGRTPTQRNARPRSAVS